MQTKKMIPHISGLKGASCLLIMFGHLFAVYKYAQEFQPRIPLADQLLNSSISFLLDEGYWVYLFFVISGYLVSKSRINSLGGIVVKSISRFFRFAFPIFFSYLIIYFIYILIGFHNGETSSLFGCIWFQNAYTQSYTFMDVLRSPIDVLLLAKVDFNPSYWVLRSMLIASVLIYVLMYCYKRLGEKYEGLCLSVLIVLCYCLSHYDQIVSACIAGMIVAVCQDSKDILKKPCFAFWAILISLAVSVLSLNMLCLLFFAFLIIFIPQVKLFNSILSSKLFDFLGKISWGVYSFHGPLLFSLGALLIIRLQPVCGLMTAYALSCLAVIVSTLLLSTLFYFSFEKLSSRLCLGLDKAMKKIISKN